MGHWCAQPLYYTLQGNVVCRELKCCIISSTATQLAGVHEGSRVGLLAVDQEVVEEEELPLLRVAGRYLDQCAFLDEIGG